MRDRGAGLLCDTLWTVAVTELSSTEDHRGGRHTFLISWEGFNFLWVHGPPTDQQCHWCLYICRNVCVTARVCVCARVVVFAHALHCRRRSHFVIDGVGGLKLRSGSFRHWLNTCTHTHTQAIRGVGLWVPPSVGCSRSVWWRTLSHSRGSYKTVTTVIFISPSLYESLVLSLVFFLLFQGAGFAFVSGCSSGMKTHMSSEVRLSQPHTHTHTLPSKSQAQNDLPRSIMLQMYLVTSLKMSAIARLSVHNNTVVFFLFWGWTAAWTHR